ncbi:MAG: hypothetical protein E7478_04340 [Ruminococcaceae bacterium]|nr:hypothetical protein [Oscillospiraceae bacterium]
MTKRRSARIVSLLVSLIMVFSLFTVFGTTASAIDIDGDWKYTLNGNKATIIGYTGSSTSITVPAKVHGYFVSNVQGICNNAHKNKVKSITFSQGIVSIDSSLCNGYTALEQISLPDGLVTIGASAFANCPNLKAVNVPSSVTSIGVSAFQNCVSLITANLKSKATVIPEHCFAGCSLLGNVYLSNSVTTIGTSAFSDCKTLAVINLPITISEIGKNAFLNCEKLSGTIVIPEDVKVINEFAFAGCRSVTTFIIPNKTKTVKSEAFRDCTSLTDIYVGDTVTKFEENALTGCSSIQRIVFGGSFVNLNRAFDMQYIPTVYYPNTRSAAWTKYTEGDKKAYSAVTSISISGNKELTVNDKNTLKVSVTPNISAVGNIYYYKSSNPNVASVDQNGVVTAKAGGTAKITVTAINGVSKSVTVKVNPKKITGVSASSLTTSSVQVKWTAAEGVTGYYVYRSTNKSSGYKNIATVTTNSYTDKGLTKGKTYYYKVRAYVKSGKTTLQSPSSAYDGVKVTAPAPTSISAKKSKSKVAKITWTKSIGAEGYEVQMATSKKGKFSTIKTITSGSTLSLTKSGLTSGKTYYFKVRAYITVNGKKVYSDYTKVVSCKV